MMYQTLQNIPKAFFSSKFLSSIAFRISLPQTSGFCHERKRNWVTRWVLRRQSFFCCCLCRCCSGSRGSAALKGMSFFCLVLCWSLHGAMEPLKKILDNENIMIELQALHLWSLAFLKSERFEAKSSSSLSLEISKHRCAQLAARPIDHKRQQLKVLQLNSTDLQQWNWSTGPKISCLLY